MSLRKSFMFLLSLGLFSANILFAAPVITNVSPAFGPSSGGTSVAISGSGFTGTTAVDFGTTTAASFIVNSDTSITAVSPAHSPQVVTLFVTAPSGTSSASDTSFFTFQGNWQAFVTNNEDNTVTIIDAVTNAVLATVSVGNSPNTLDILPDGSMAYIANSSDSSISVIATSTDSVVNTISNISGQSFDITVMAVTPDGSKNYIILRSSNAVAVIDNASQTQIATISVGNDPLNIAITPDGTKVYVTNGSDSSVSVISTASDTVINTISVESLPIAASATPDSSKVYVSNFSSGTVSAITTASNAVASITVESFPRAIAVTPDGTKVLIANGGSSTVSVISTATDMVVAT
ncbi:MAG: IPT/TIG domain-containing protein, partial [Verrucomicrobia bacterium]|nr:IPT/TIG domain-containing protein [Verrucomicrobiota bacterium]